MTRFFFFFFFFFFFRGGGGGGGLSKWAIRFLTGVGVNLYDLTDDSKKIEIKDLGRAKRIIVTVKFQSEC